MGVDGCVAGFPFFFIDFVRVDVEHSIYYQLLMLKSMKNNLMKKLQICIIFLMTLFLCSCGGDDGKDVDYLFPKELQNKFSEVDIDVNKCAIKFDVEKPLNWEKKWKAFFVNNKDISANDVYKEAQAMCYDCGMSGSYDWYDYNTKEKVDIEVAGNKALVATATHGFWGFFAWFGELLVRLCGGYGVWALLGAWFIASFIASLGAGIAQGAPILGFFIGLLGLFFLIGVDYCQWCYSVWVMIVNIILFGLPMLFRG